MWFNEKFYASRNISNNRVQGQSKFFWKCCLSCCPLFKRDPLRKSPYQCCLVEVKISNQITFPWLCIIIDITAQFRYIGCEKTLLLVLEINMTHDSYVSTFEWRSIAWFKGEFFIQDFCHLLAYLCNFQ